LYNSEIRAERRLGPAMLVTGVASNKFLEKYFQPFPALAKMEKNRAFFTHCAWCSRNGMDFL